MPQLYTVPAGASVAAGAAALMRRQCGLQGLADAIALVPTRRSCITLRDALTHALDGTSALLPQIIPLADIAEALLPLLGVEALAAIRAIPPAMPESERRYLLARQILLFEKRRLMRAIAVADALPLADSLIALQDRFTRAGIAMTQEVLRPLIARDVADHWKQALQFLAILTDSWPALERETGMVTQARREVMALELLARHWQEHPPARPVYVIGSTASQPATARLMNTIADSAQGHVILPGFPNHLEDWRSLAPGHPLFHLAQFLAMWPAVEPSDIVLLAEEESPNLWREALAPVAALAQWPQMPLPPWQSIALVPAAHAEEEARVIAIMVREALAVNAAGRVAVLTPDEGLLARVASHLRRDGILPDRLSDGTLAQTEIGSLWIALAYAIAEGASPRAMLALLRHPALQVESDLVLSLDKSWRGLSRTAPGKMPRHDPALTSHPHYAVVQTLLHTTRELSERTISPGAWISACRNLLVRLVPDLGDGVEEEAIDALAHAQALGSIDAQDFYHLLQERLDAPRRDAGIAADPRVVLITPVEARLERFDRVILASMTEDVWPGVTPANPWLNLAMQAALGLPPPEEHVSLMAHDVLMHGSAPEVRITYAQRKDGSPTVRSRFLERLLTRLAAGGVGEAAITAGHYLAWTRAREAAGEYAPEPPVYPRPTARERPNRLPVTDLDTLFADPFAIYAKQVLGLRRLEDIDAEPEASDFGSLTHRALHALTLHWNAEHRPATEAELAAMVEQALRALSERPAIDLFWRARLLGGLTFVNRLEAARRPEIRGDVAPEQPVEGEIAGVQLYGRIDRVEEGGVVIDYKTGAAPGKKEILEGSALQLLVYGMLLDPAAEASVLEYWQLPRLGEEGEVTRLTRDEAGGAFAEIRAKLAENLRQFLSPDTPFLATPDERYGSDYNGISRYDEWAG